MKFIIIDFRALKSTLKRNYDNIMLDFTIMSGFSFIIIAVMVCFTSCTIRHHALYNINKANTIITKL